MERTLGILQINLLYLWDIFLRNSKETVVSRGKYNAESFQCIMIFTAASKLSFFNKKFQVKDNPTCFFIDLLWVLELICNALESPMVNMWSEDNYKYIKPSCLESVLSDFLCCIIKSINSFNMIHGACSVQLSLVAKFISDRLKKIPENHDTRLTAYVLKLREADKLCKDKMQHIEDTLTELADQLAIEEEEEKRRNLKIKIVRKKVVSHLSKNKCSPLSNHKSREPIIESIYSMEYKYSKELSALSSWEDAMLNVSNAYLERDMSSIHQYLKEACEVAESCHDKNTLLFITYSEEACIYISLLEQEIKEIMARQEKMNKFEAKMASLDFQSIETRFSELGCEYTKADALALLSSQSIGLPLKKDRYSYLMNVKFVLLHLNENCHHIQNLRSCIHSVISKLNELIGVVVIAESSRPYIDVVQQGLRTIWYVEGWLDQRPKIIHKTLTNSKKLMRLIKVYGCNEENDGKQQLSLETQLTREAKEFSGIQIAEEDYPLEELVIKMMELQQSSLMQATQQKIKISEEIRKKLQQRLCKMKIKGCDNAVLP
ncbi:hypothetical protein CI610_00610 [invertebrate metagenome]|uniref:Uncharacterized protein n=1 Tax=invertebrate metagenome TaxID=1711999 RepID=A0A2H9TB54_9ZZZZ